jgi:hypothetical protein
MRSSNRMALPPQWAGESIPDRWIGTRPLASLSVVCSIDDRREPLSILSLGLHMSRPEGTRFHTVKIVNQDRATDGARDRVA